jgi:SAM-dependent methyltransferase
MSVSDFYDALAPHYHLNYEDWGASIDRQSRQLDALLRSRGISPPDQLLDLACGIGTQTLGLAANGYSLTASDISAVAVRRAEAEAAKRDLTIRFSTADLRSAFEHHGRTFDAVLACDNAIPHLLTDAEILAAFGQMYRCTRPGGTCLISVRDYDSIDRTALLQARPPIVHEQDGVRRIIFQVWAFDGEFYDLSLYLVDDSRGAAPVVEVTRTRYYAVAITSLLQLMRDAGFVNVERVDGMFYQPIIVGTRSAA